MAQADQDRLIAVYTRAVQAVRHPLIELLLRIWAALAGYHDRDAQDFTRRVVPIVGGAQRQVAALTAAYMARIVADMTGQPPGRPAGIPDDFGPNLRGVDPVQVYTRPFVTVRTELAAGVPLDTAADRGRQRLESIAATDVQLAKTHAARASLTAAAADDERVAGYRRVLVGEHNCGLCVVASTQRYHIGDLLPIHPGCDCGVAPIIGRTDPGQVVDQPLLDAAHDTIAERFGQRASDARRIDYRKVLLVRTHGELGPVLTVAGHRFTSQEDLR